MNFPLTFRCEECGAPSVGDTRRMAYGQPTPALQNAKRGRDVRSRHRQLNVGWIRSIASVPDHEMTAVLQSHYPDVAKIQQQQQEHETATGHSVRLHGWWALCFYENGDLGQSR